MPNIIKGVYTALITPFKANGRGIDESVLRDLIQRQIAAGIQGIVLGGSTGEGQTLEMSELETLLKVALEHKGKIQVIGACGMSGTQATADRYHWISQTGVDAVLVSNPAYNKPPQRGLVAHFEAIAARASTPLIVYNIPGRSSVNLLPESLKTLWAIPHILAVKESSGSIEQIQSVLGEIPQGKVLLSGDDPLNLSVWALGGQGTVSVLSNVLPEKVAELWSLWNQGKMESARTLHLKLSRITQLLFSESNPIPTKFAVGSILKKDLLPRLPLVSLDEKFKAPLLQELKSWL